MQLHYSLMSTEYWDGRLFDDRTVTGHCSINWHWHGCTCPEDMLWNLFLTFKGFTHTLLLVVFSTHWNGLGVIYWEITGVPLKIPDVSGDLHLITWAAKISWCNLFQALHLPWSGYFYGHLLCCCDLKCLELKSKWIFNYHPKQANNTSTL